MNNPIYPCITIKGRVSEAADFYINCFSDGRITSTSQWVIQIELKGQKLMLLNEGPSSSPNPAISFMVICNNSTEAERYWNKLNEDGKILMPLDSYPFSERYGWIEDKFGVSWQIFTGDDVKTEQKICPTLMFVGEKAGKAREAMELYTQLFPSSKIIDSVNYQEGEDNTSFLKHGRFSLDNYLLMAMDSSMDHGFSFVDAVSLVVECVDQEEIDKYWNALALEGGREVACGWLTDRFGVSWQIIPENLSTLLTDPKAIGAMMKMKKLIIADLENPS